MNNDQIAKLSDIASDIGLVALASVVLPAVLDKFNLLMIILGSVAALALWIISILLRR